MLTILMTPQEPAKINKQGNYNNNHLRKGPWLEEEDEQLVSFISLFGERKWDFIATASGLRRSGKSCRLRWLNYLRPNLKRGQISEEEEQIIIQLHDLWGNKWAKIARRLPGRTDNEIKNYWRTHLRKKTQLLQQGNNLNQEFKREKGNFDTEDCKAIEEMKMGLTNNNVVSMEQYDQYMINSPRLYNEYYWVSELSSSSISSGGYQNEIMKLNHDHHKACDCFDSCLSCLNFNGEDVDFGISDSVGSLWDMS